MSFIYLASPYTDPDPEVMQERFEQTEKVVAGMLRLRHHVYSPIVHCHALALRYDLPKDFDFWMDYNFNVLREAASLWVLKLPGWTASRGVSAEIEFAKTNKIFTHYLEP